MKQTLVIFLIVASLLSIGGVIFVKNNIKPNNREKYTDTTNSQTETAPETAHVIVTLEPFTQQTLNGQETTFDVVVNADTHSVVGMEAYFIYDPTTIEIISIDSGSLFEKSEVLFKNIDTTKGIISYSIGTLSPKASQGILFTIKSKNLVGNQMPVITFDQTRTKVAVFSSLNKTPISEQETQIQFIEKPVRVL